MPDLDELVVPSGVVGFLFTDVEGSTALWASDAGAMSASLRVHDDVVRSGIEGRGGYVFTTAGDAFCAAFQRAFDAVAAAEQIQEALDLAPWPGRSLRVRIGVHLGEADERAGDYFGPTVNTAARVEVAGHGGQILGTESGSYCRQPRRHQSPRLQCASLPNASESPTSCSNNVAPKSLSRARTP